MTGHVPPSPVTVTARRVTSPGAVRLLLLFTFCASGPGCLGPVRGFYPPPNGAETVDVYIVNNHWHTGFVLERATLSPRLKEALAPFEGTDFVEIGWGDEGFYRAEKITSEMTMRALFVSRGSVVHVLGIDATPEAYYREWAVDVYRVRVSAEGYGRLLEYIEASFAWDDEGHAIRLQKGLGLQGQESCFFAARGRYAGWHTCNHWSADGLRTTGFPITPGYAFTADNVGWQIRRFGTPHQPDIVVQRQ